MRLPIVLAVLIVALVPRGIAAADGGPVLTRCADIRVLSREEAAKHQPVSVRGVVTFTPGSWTSFTLDDGVGIWVEMVGSDVRGNKPPKLRVGDLVEVVGVSHEGMFAPTIAAQELRVVGRGPLPVPTPLETLGLGATRYGSQRVTAAGVVQAAETVVAGGAHELRLLISTPVGHFNYVLRSANEPPTQDLVDAEVTLTGVLICEYNKRRQFIGVRVFSNDPADLIVTRVPARDAFTSPAMELRDVMNFSATGIDPHRRRVTGTVTLCAPGQFFYVQQDGWGLRVSTSQPEALNPGDVVEVAGFLRMENYRAQMSNAVFRRLGQQSSPSPVAIASDAMLTSDPNSTSSTYDDCLVTLTARLVSVVHVADSPLVLNLERNGQLIPAGFFRDLPAPALEALRPGSELRVTGICTILFSDPHHVMDWPRPASLRLMLRGPADVAVVQAASWWTPGRLWAALGLTGGVMVLAVGWSTWLRRVVAQRSAQLAEEIRARRDAAVDFESTLRERNRLACDLHDTLEQALTGLAFQLEASDALRTESPATSGHHLGLARQLLARSREDLRRSIWNLRDSRLEENTLYEALQEIGEDRSAGQAARIEVVREGEVRPLQPLVAGNLLLLAQEGITNSLKHARPASIELRLTFLPVAVRLAIRDDGCGFDPATAAGAKDGHFGLQGMHERMKRLGGTLKIESAPARGTLITVQVPA